MTYAYMAWPMPHARESEFTASSDWKQLRMLKMSPVQRWKIVDKTVCRTVYPKSGAI